MSTAKKPGALRAAEEAISDYFGDKSATIAGLEELREQIDLMIEAMKDDLKREEGEQRDA
jgi:hypothetical protein